MLASIVGGMVPTLVGTMAGALFGGNNHSVVHEGRNVQQTIRPVCNPQANIAPQFQFIFNNDTRGKVTPVIAASHASPLESKQSDVAPMTDAEETPSAPTLFNKVPTVKPWMVATTLAAGGSCYLFYTFRTAETLMRSPKRWCNWNKDLEQEATPSSPQEDPAQELVMAIQRRYTSTKYVHNFVQPLKSFLKDVEQESATLQRYLHLGSFVHHLFLGKLFGVNEDSLKNAEDCLEHLEHLKKVFTAWSAEFKTERSFFNKRRQHQNNFPH